MTTCTKIPSDFFIGTSSSAWQIEGNAGKHADQDSWADRFYKTKPELWHDGIGPDTACDFYHTYVDDIRTMASFGMTAFRFTIQWARFMKDPIRGIVDEDAAIYYQNVIDTIIENGMKPIISLEHWDIPASFFDENEGWADRKVVDYYEIYVQKALELYAQKVKSWFAFTEPNIPIDNGYMDELWYPFKHDPKIAYQAHFHKILATARAVNAIEPYKEFGCEMGAMVHMTPVYARSGEIQDVTAAYYADLFHVRLYLDPYLKGVFPQELIAELKRHDCMFTYQPQDLVDIQEHQIDVLGVDYYFPIRVKAREYPYVGDFHPQQYYEPWLKPDRKFNSDRGWEIYEKAVYDVGMRIKNQYGNKKWFISENGIGIENEDKYRNSKGYIDDDYRIDFLKEHLKYALKAKADGCNCQGYLVWSFIDNVSAINAFKNRYGLLELDLNTKKRIPKKSLYWFSEIMKNKEFDD